MEAAWLTLARRRPARRPAAGGAGRRRRGRGRPPRPAVGRAAGGPRRGAGTAARDDIAVDLRVDDHADPIPELRRLLDLNDLYLTASDRATRRCRSPPSSRRARRRCATALGHRDFAAWVGTENYEMRVAADGSWIDVRDPRRSSGGTSRMSVLADRRRHHRRHRPGRRAPTARIAAKGYQEFAQHFPQPGWVEHVPEEIWQATLEATRAGPQRRTTSRELAGGRHHQPARDRRCCGTARRSGSPRRAIVWQDRRTADICARAARRGPRGPGRAS